MEVSQRNFWWGGDGRGQNVLSSKELDFVICIAFCALPPSPMKLIN